ncbi:hypothetical protein [Bradyrhizobium liaoningense]
MMVLSKAALRVGESANNCPAGAKFLKLSERHLKAEMMDWDPRGEDQSRTIPNRKSSATVIRPEIRSDPRHPSRFEKKKNMPLPAVTLPFGSNLSNSIAFLTRFSPFAV